MCTAISYNGYFGRNLDLEYSYNEQVVITPQSYTFTFSDNNICDKHYSLIGMAIVRDNYPLYYDACNEYGLAGAGLSFPYNDLYCESGSEIQIAPYEILPLVLRNCKNISEVKSLLNKAIFVNKSFNENFAATNMHYMFSDKESSITVESKNGKIKIFDNDLNTLTNAPNFLEQIKNYEKYKDLTSKETDNSRNSKGTGAIGLPGDFTSMSRFVKTAFLIKHSVCEKGETITQFFHILDASSEPKGSVNLGDNKYFYTRYSSCIDLKEKIYYYKTYENNRINAVGLINRYNEELITFNLEKQQDIHFNN